MTELWNYEKVSPPFKRADRYFYFYNNGLQNQNVIYWLESLDSEPQLLLDPNTLSEDGTVALSGTAVSRDGKLLAYGLSEAGSDWQTWHVRLVDDGKDLEDRIEWVKFSGASWDKNAEGFFYSRYDAPDGAALKQANYYHKLYYHKLGMPQSDDRLIYERPDQKEWGFFTEVTEDGCYLIINVWHGTASENAIFYLDLMDPEAEVVELLSDFDAEYILVGNQGSQFFFKTDHDARQHRVIAIDVEKPTPEDWRELIPEVRDKLEYVDFVGEHFICTYLHHAANQVRLFKMDGMPDGELQLPGPGTVIGFSGRSDDPETFYQFSNFTTPGIVFHFNSRNQGKHTLQSP